MTSQIAADSIDEDFPVADQDNDSQGFRDNFSVIKNSLLTAASEISDLQTNSARLGSDENNDFRGGVISNVRLLNVDRVKLEGTVANNQIVADTAYYFTVNKTDSGPITINWPSNDNENYVEIMLEILSPNTNISAISVNFFGNVKTNFNNLLQLQPGETAFFKCWITEKNVPGRFSYIQFIDKFQ